MTTFDSLVAALNGYFEKPLSAMPKVLQQRIEAEFSQWNWDNLEPEQRRSVAEQLDIQHDPANKEEREQYFELVCEEDRIKDETRALNLSNPKGDPLNIASKERQLAELREELSRVQQSRNDLEAKQYAAHGDRSKPGRRPVSTDAIIRTFPVKNDLDENAKWWKERISEAGRGKYVGLNECIAHKGKPGRGGGQALLWPQMIAGWLIEKKNMTKKLAAANLRQNFPDYADEADLICPADK